MPRRECAGVRMYIWWDVCIFIQLCIFMCKDMYVCACARLWGRRSAHTQIYWMRPQDAPCVPIRLLLSHALLPHPPPISSSLFSMCCCPVRVAPSGVIEEVTDIRSVLYVCALV